MAGAGFKTFGVGDVLTASDVNTYLMQQAVMAFADSGARGSAIGTAVLSEGMVSYLADTDAVEVYDGSAWTAVNVDPAILQVVSTTDTAAFSASIASYTETDAGSLSVTITPSSSSSKVLITYEAHIANSSGYARGGTILYRNASALIVGDAASSRTRGTTWTGGFQTNGNDNSVATMTYLDSPATTSATTYKVRLHNPASTTQTVYLNRTHSDQNSAGVVRPVSSITVMEVSA